jgi:hypothetical protein
MHISHDPVVITNARDAKVARRANIERTKLSDGVVVAYNQLARLTRIFFVLWNCTDRIELENVVVVTNGGAAFNHTVRTNLSARPYLNVGTYNGVRAYTHTAVQLGLWVNDGGGVNQTHDANKP